jgi:D-glycero-alpha-D-manno-heptose-7-phosphate kinase
MIITRTPLRITLAGGGTDLPSYYEQHGGYVVSAAISKYVYIAINRTFTDDYFLKYSALERVSRPEEVQHPIVREALAMHPIGPSLEIVSIADIPAGTGLGSSGAFTVGLLRAIYAYKREHVTAGALAEEACSIEIDRLDQPVGKQDQYIAAFGGLTCFDFDRDGTVRVSPLQISNETLHDLEEHLLMFFTGYSRDATSVLEDQQKRSQAGDEAMLQNLHQVKESGYEITKALERGDTTRFAELMHEHWLAKRGRSIGMSNERINRWYDLGLANGAVGGKLVGAGGGGFLLFYATDQASVRAAMSREGLAEVRFFFDHDGSTVTARGA